MPIKDTAILFIEGTIFAAINITIAIIEANSPLLTFPKKRITPIKIMNICPTVRVKELGINFQLVEEDTVIQSE